MTVDNSGDTWEIINVTLNVSDGSSGTFYFSFEISNGKWTNWIEHVGFYEDSSTYSLFLNASLINENIGETISKFRILSYDNNDYLSFTGISIDDILTLSLNPSTEIIGKSSDCEFIAFDLIESSFHVNVTSQENCPYPPSTTTTAPTSTAPATTVPETTTMDTSSTGGRGSTTVPLTSSSNVPGSSSSLSSTTDVTISSSSSIVDSTTSNTGSYSNENSNTSEENEENNNNDGAMDAATLLFVIIAILLFIIFCLIAFMFYFFRCYTEKNKQRQASQKKGELSHNISTNTITSTDDTGAMNLNGNGIFIGIK